MAVDLDAVNDRYQYARLAGLDSEANGWDPAKLRALVASWQDVASLHDEVLRVRRLLEEVDITTIASADRQLRCNACGHVRTEPRVVAE